MSIEQQNKDWEDLARLNPLWAILSDPATKTSGWDISKFFDTGEEEVKDLETAMQRLGYPRSRDSALDFGCGVGRVTRALAKRFKTCDGIDVSQEMVSLAMKCNHDITNCRFTVNKFPDLRQFPPGHFDLVYSYIVLQHVPQKMIATYISEFARVVSEGGLVVFQLPSYIPPLLRLQPRRRLYSVLSRFGIPQSFLFSRLGLYPIRMSSLSQTEVVGLMTAQGLLSDVKKKVTESGVISNTYYARKPNRESARPEPNHPNGVEPV